MTSEGRTPGREDALRCDHCANFISHRHQTDVYNLEGIVSEGLEIDWAICGKCFKKHPASDRAYWDGWVTKKTASQTESVL